MVLVTGKRFEWRRETQFISSSSDASSLCVKISMNWRPSRLISWCTSKKILSSLTTIRFTILSLQKYDNITFITVNEWGLICSYLKARGKSGPLFSFDVHDDVRIVSDASVEKDESHAGKVLLRNWYERNKHIFPASRWEPYDPTKTYEKYSIKDKKKN